VEIVRALPDGRVLTSSRNGPLRVWDLRHAESRPLLPFTESTMVHDLCVLPNGLAASTSLRELFIWDTNAHRRVRAIDYEAKTGRDVPFRLTVLSDGRLASAGYTAPLRVTTTRESLLVTWDPVSWEPSIKGSVSPMAWGFGAVGLRLVCALLDSTVVIIDSDSGTVLQRLEAPDPCPMTNQKRITAFSDDTFVLGLDSVTFRWRAGHFHLLEDEDGNQRALSALGVFPSGKILWGGEPEEDDPMTITLHVSGPKARRFLPVLTRAVQDRLCA
jgi:WD40 repeat protein